MPLQDWLRDMFIIRRPTAPSPLEPGLYAFIQETAGDFNRFHLRVERDGSGMLIVNANAGARLTPTGTLIVKDLLDGKDEAAIVRDLTTHFHGAATETMQADLEQVRALIAALTTRGDLYPIFNLDDPALSPRNAELIAPLQADVRLASPATLVPLIDRLWEVAIPHICLYAPPDLEAEHLIRAVERAEDLGMIAGVRGRASDLAQEGLLAALVQAGVDYVRLLFVADDPEIHDALCGEGDHAQAIALFDWLEANEICAVAEMPLLTQTANRLEETAVEMLRLGVDSVAFVAYVTTAPEVAQAGVLLADAMPQVATQVEEIAAETGLRFLWNPPVQRDPVRTLIEQVLEGPRTSGDVAVHIEPDGTVLPPRGPARAAGNLLTDSWPTIWDDAAFVRYRERVESPTHCEHCPGLTICAADCPREPAGWAQV